MAIVELIEFRSTLWRELGEGAAVALYRGRNRYGLDLRRL